MNGEDRTPLTSARPNDLDCQPRVSLLLVVRLHQEAEDIESLLRSADKTRRGRRSGAISYTLFLSAQGRVISAWDAVAEAVERLRSEPRREDIAAVELVVGLDSGSHGVTIEFSDLFFASRDVITELWVDATRCGIDGEEADEIRINGPNAEELVRKMDSLERQRGFSRALRRSIGDADKPSIEVELRPSRGGAGVVVTDDLMEACYAAGATVTFVCRPGTR